MEATHGKHTLKRRWRRPLSGTKKTFCNRLHIIIRDIANTDYTLEKLRELAPAALVGEQNFFIAYGLHKVA